MLNIETYANSSRSDLNYTVSKIERHLEESELAARLNGNILLSYKLPEGVTIFLSSSLEFGECRHREVLNCIDLKCYSIEELSECTRADVRVERLYCRRNHQIYILQIRLHLFAIKKRESQLEVLKVLKNVISFSSVSSSEINPACICECIVRVKFKDGNTIYKTFVDEAFDELVLNEAMPGINTILKQIQDHKNEIRVIHQQVSSETGKLVLQMFKARRILSRLLIKDVSGILSNYRCYSNSTTHINSQDPDELCPLVRYGSSWVTVVNDKIVFGIPIANSSSRR